VEAEVAPAGFVVDDQPPSAADVEGQGVCEDTMALTAL
jgi:hypothetical protein